jgi:hypothetical protein
MLLRPSTRSFCRSESGVKHCMQGTLCLGSRYADVIPSAGHLVITSLTGVITSSWSE